MFVNQKAVEICYALIRVAAQIRKVDLKNSINRLAFRFMEEVTSENFDIAIKTSSAIEAMLKIGQALYEVEPVNAKVISGELEAVNAEMRQALGIDGLPNLDRFFENRAPKAAIRQELGNSAKTFADIRPTTIFQDSDSSVESGNGNGFSATIRQSAILDRIRQSANGQAAPKDLIAAFPETSERPMRYDLQKLCLQGLIDRVGNGGPGGYYILKNRA
ncbi:MAG: hypothetical protein Q8L24_00440 [bacterium]|nr:hypothetical protein [bacterium]